MIQIYLNLMIKSINLIIDSTLIINKYGIEGVGYGGESKKKK